MNETPIIINWEKWKDPYGSDIEKSEWPGAFGNFETDELIKKSENKYKDSYDLDDDDDEDGGFIDVPGSNRPLRNMKVMATPMGLIPMIEHTNPCKIFNFWIGHTNFPLTLDHIEILDHTLGIESLDVWTPYRFRIAIGKAFSSVNVKQDIMKRLGVTQSADTDEN